MTAATRKKIFSEGTLLPVGMVLGTLIPLAISGIVGVWYLRGYLNDYTNAFVQLDGRVAVVEKTISISNKIMMDKFTSLEIDRWNYPMMRNFTDALGYQNPTLVVPDSRQIKSDNFKIN